MICASFCSWAKCSVFYFIAAFDTFETRTKAGLAQTQSYVSGVKDKINELIGRVDAATTQFIVFGSIVVNVMVQAGAAVLAVSGHVASLAAILFRLAQAYLGLTVHIDTHNTKLKMANFFLDNFHKEIRLSLGFLGSFADYLDRINFPLTQLTRFIDGLSKAEIVLGIGRGKRENLFDHLPESIRTAESGIKQFQAAFKNAQEDIKRDLQRFGAAAMAETVIQWRGVKFEGSFADVKKTVSAPIEALKSLRNELLDMGATIAVSTEGLAKMQAIAGQMGFPVDEIDDFVKLIAKGSVAFELLPEQAAESFGTLKNIYGIGLKELEYFGDQINYIADSAGGKVGESALLNVLTRAGGMAQRFGLLRGETVALSAAMLAMGKPPEIVGTALDDLLSKLQNAPGQTKDFQVGLQQLGLDATALAIDIETHPKQALDDFLQRLADVKSSRLQSDILGKLIGDAGETKGVIGDLIGNLAEYQRLAGLIDTGNVAGSMDATFKERQKTVEAALMMMKNAWDGVAVSISTMFLPTIRAAVEVLRDLAVWLRKVNDEYPNLTAFARIALIFGTLGNVLALAFRVLPGVAAGAGAAIAAGFRTGLISGIRAVSGAIGPIVTGLWSTVIGQFVIRLLAGVAIVQVGLSNVLGAIGALSSALIALASNPITLFMMGLGVLAARLIGAGGLFARLGVAATGLGGIFMRLVGGPIGLIISAIAFLIVKYNEIKDEQIKFGSATVTLSEIIEASWNLITNVFTQASAVLGATLSWLQNRWDNLWQSIGVDAEALPSLAQNFKNLANSIIGVFSGLGKGIGVGLAQMVEEIKTSFKHAVSLAQAAAEDIKAAFTDFDFTGRHFAEQWDANQRENQEIEKRRGENTPMDALASGWREAYKGDAIGTFISQGMIEWLDAVNAEIQRMRSENADTSPLSKEQRKNQGSDGGIGTTVDAATYQKAVQAALGAQLSGIKMRQDALKTSHDLELKQLESTFSAEKLKLEQQVVEQVITEQQKNEQTLALTKELDSKKLTLERQFIEQSSQYEKAAIAAKIQAEQASIPDGKYAGLLSAAQQKYHLPDGLVQAVMQVESSGNPDAVSKAGAAGLMQLMPATAKSLGVKDVFDPKQNIEGGAKLLRELLDTFGGDVNKALAAYNSTPSKVKAAHGDLDKLPKETQDYVPKVLEEIKNPSTGGTAEEREARAARLKILNNEMVASEQDRVAKLKSIGIDEQNATIEQSKQELALKKDDLDKQKAIAEEKLQAKHDAALDAVAVQEQAAQQELDIGNISQSEYLEKIKGFADERLKIEQKLLDEKRKLLDEDKLALLQNMYAKEAAERASALERQKIINDAEKEKKAVFDGMFAPFQNALQQMTNGVLTGQQTITNAVRNAANSILVSYTSTFIQQRVMQTAQWAWQLTGIEVTGAKEKALKEGDVIWAVMLAAKEKAVLAGQWAWETLGFAKKETTKRAISQGSIVWDTLMAAKKKVIWAAEWAWETVNFGLKEAKKRALSLATSAWETLLSAKKKIVLAAEWVWETLGFGAKEAAKTETKIVAEGAQTSAQVLGDTIRAESSVASAETSKAATADTAKSSIMDKALDAAAGAYNAMVGIPYVGPIIAPIAAAVAFVGVSAFGAMIGSAKGGEWQVGEDGSPYILHEKESVLPAGVANHFRQVVEYVQNGGLSERKTLDPSTALATINAMVDNGSLRPMALPDNIVRFAEGSNERAATLAQTARQYDQHVIKQAVAAQSPLAASASTSGRRRDELHIHTVSAEELFSKNSHVIVKQLAKEARRFNKGTS